MTKKTIFVILPHFGGGGAERSTLNLINNWINKNYEIYLILMSKEGELISYLDKKIHVIDLKCKRIIHTIIPCFKLFKKYRPDITLVLMWPLTSVILVSWLLSLKVGKLFVADHNPFTNSWFEDFKINKIIFYIIYNLTYTFATGIICVSKNVKSQIKNFLIFNKKKIYQINNSISRITEINNPKLVRKKLYGSARFCFLSVGRLKKSRDVITVLKALKNFEYIQESKLIILGNGPEEYNLKKYVIENNMDKIVEFKGFVQDTYKYYSTADLYIHSSLYDALPLTLIEALFYNIKILSTDCPYGPSEILKHNNLGILVPVNNHKEMLKGIHISLNSKINLEQRNIKKKEYEVNNVSNRYLNVFFN